jgi:putative DNA primase/helicase
MKAEEIARALNGHRSGHGFLVRCPVSTHGRGRGDKRPSLFVRDGDMPGRVLVWCYAGCNPCDVLDTLRARGLIHHSSERRPAWGCPPWKVTAKPTEPSHSPDPEALALWRSSTLGAGTIVETYISGRGIDIPIPPSIRFAIIALACVTAPAMIAAVQSPDGQVIATQRTLLTWRGTKAHLPNPRHNCGLLGAGAVRLAKATNVLGLAEGVETALAAMQLTGIPCWASLGATRMHNVKIPAFVREVHTFADDDRAGHDAVERVIKLHTSLGRQVVKRLPPAGMNDYAELTEALSKEKKQRYAYE